MTEIQFLALMVTISIWGILIMRSLGRIYDRLPPRS